MLTTSHEPKESARTLLGKNLRRLRAEKGWSQEDLALEADLHRTFVAHVERGVRNISIDNIEKLAAAFRIPVHCLLLPEALYSSLPPPDSSIST